MEIATFTDNNDENFKFYSKLSDKLKQEPCLLGIDEAGRGPVLGPMVYAACFVPISCKQKLADLGCDDSKVLKEAQRDKLFEVLNEATSDFVGWIINILSPTFVSTSMLGRAEWINTFVDNLRTKYNLNAMSHDTAIDLIRSVIKFGVDVKEVYVDTVGPPETYQAKLKRHFPGIKCTVEKKADSKFPVVSAASICAKVCRDKAVSDWKFREGDKIDRNYGSGYPADPNTKAWLKKNIDRIFGFPNFVRFSWSTASKLLDSEAVNVKWQDDDEEIENGDTPAITSFFGAKKTSDQRHRFFLDNHLKIVDSI